MERRDDPREALGLPPHRAPGPAPHTSAEPTPEPTPEPAPSPEVAHDLHWARDLRSAVRCSALLLALLLLIDHAAGTLTGPRVLLWTGLAALLLLVLYPARVAVGEGWLSTRGLLGTRRVRTDHLVSVRCLDGVGQRLVLRDTSGARVEIDPRLLVANPALWHRLDDDARTSALRGSLVCGATALRRVSERVDDEAARAVFKVSGLD
ncbi:hypothetical protein [Streptomyces sp. NPDC058202]|uniref:hypothetical protein n=1 Tax=Streptomyces sp. NPDC058202 TaxID=3346380 RepID=UPI0036F189AA